jgi:uncharacterized membrane protein
MSKPRLDTVPSRWQKQMEETLRTSLRPIAAVSGLIMLAPSAANADLIFCNQFTQSIYAAIAYQQQDGSWISRGWLNVDPGKCASFDSALTLKGFYYRVESVPYRVNGRQVTGSWGNGDGSFAIYENSNFQYWNAQAKPLNSTMAPFTRNDNAVSEKENLTINILLDKPTGQ